jgi:hypothetical protein
MAARAIQLQVQGTLDGVTPFVAPDPLPAVSADGVLRLDAGAGINVGRIDLGDLIQTTSPVWLRSYHVEYAAAVRAARSRIRSANLQPTLLKQVDAGDPTLMKLLTLSPNCIVPPGGELDILTDDTDETFGGAPVAGPHFVYFEIDGLPTDEDIGLVQDVMAASWVKTMAEGQRYHSFQAVAAAGSDDVALIEPRRVGEASNPIRVPELNADAQVIAADVTIGDAAAAGESMQIDIIRVANGTGGTSIIATITIDDTFAANTSVVIPITQLSNQLLAGDRIRIGRTYVAGMAPAPLTNTLVRVQTAPLAF